MLTPRSESFPFTAPFAVVAICFHLKMRKEEIVQASLVLIRQKNIEDISRVRSLPVYRFSKLHIVEPDLEKRIDIARVSKIF